MVARSLNTGTTIDNAIDRVPVSERCAVKTVRDDYVAAASAEQEEVLPVAP